MNTSTKLVITLVFYTFGWARPTTRATDYFMLRCFLFNFPITFLELTPITCHPPITSFQWKRFQWTSVYAVFAALKPIKNEIFERFNDLLSGFAFDQRLFDVLMSQCISFYRFERAQHLSKINVSDINKKNTSCIILTYWNLVFVQQQLLSLVWYFY